MNGFKVDELSENVYNEIKAIIEGTVALTTNLNRVVKEGDVESKNYALSKLEAEISNLDISQQKAAISLSNGPQRIRGLAGSGKTIILCLKAALLHLKYPDKKILYTFYTKSLYDFIEGLINKFYKLNGSGELPNYNNIHIRQSWGGASIDGVYYETCKRENVSPWTFSEAYKQSRKPFDFICKELIEIKKGVFNEYYDIVLIDEGQDFRPSFYQLCRAIVKNDAIIWAYDELQNIFDVEIQDATKIFINKYHKEEIDIDNIQEEKYSIDKDVVLEKSYRNSRIILVAAHALGFSIYGEKLLQTIDSNSFWNDLGYQVVKGESRTGDVMHIVRPERTSPIDVTKYYDKEDQIQLYSFDKKYL
jgi:superfamily I DNA and RNA helicase